MASVRQQQSYLVEQQRQAQVATQAGFLAEFLAAWGLLQLDDLDASTPNWLRIVIRLIRAFRQESADSSLRHYRDLRRLALPDVDFDMPDVVFDLGDVEEAERRIARFRRARASTVDRASSPARWEREARQLQREVRRLRIHWDRADRAAIAALQVAGPINIKQRIARGAKPEAAKRAALVEAAGAASRHVLNGGRSTTLTLVDNDRAALGWIRVTDGNPCYFCAMLASRGAVYKSDSFSESDPRFTGPGQVKVHDSCGCGVMPVFSRNQAWPGRSREFHDLWNDNIRGRYSAGGVRPGRQSDALRAWRRLYERPETFTAKQDSGRSKRAA